MTKILHIDASSMTISSSSRKLSAAIVKKLNVAAEDVTYRDLSTSNLQVITEAQIGSFFTPAADRSEDQKQVIKLSDSLVEELRANDTIVLGVPMYNFNVPASLKLYQDLVARVGETFIYTEEGPKGLLEGKKIYVAVTTGGVPIGSPADSLTPSLKTFFGFIGITDITFINADGTSVDLDKALETAYAEIEKLVA
ncbi:MAG: NAD(P)H-dependent oxidoreductase [Rhizobiales bacterium]|nr:NAD(P)H-dependent oxidoreductase [Hyphomicrobiales bacterium]